MNNHSSNEEPEIVVIGQKKVVIDTGEKQTIKVKPSTYTQNLKTDGDAIFKMTLTINVVVDLGD